MAETESQQEVIAETLVPPEGDPAPVPAKNPAAKIAAVVVVVLLGLVVLYAMADRMAPSSSRGVVSAHVVQIAPRVSGEVTQVHVEDDAVVQAGDPLFSLNPRPFELAVQQATANLTATTQSIDAVSYTHLDVYKRQVPWLSESWTVASAPVSKSCTVCCCCLMAMPS